MSTLKIFKFLNIRRDDSYFPDFEQAGQLLVNGAELLKLLIVNDKPQERDQFIRQIKELETRSDKITAKIYIRLNKSFISPFNREDIHELASNIDDVMDSIDDVSGRIGSYQPSELTPFNMEMTEIIYQTTLQIYICLNCLRKAGSEREKIFQASHNINILGKRANEIFFSGISDSLNKEKNLIELIKKEETLEDLDKCICKADSVAFTIKSILLKL